MPFLSLGLQTAWQKNGWYEAEIRSRKMCNSFDEAKPVLLVSFRRIWTSQLTVWSVSEENSPPLSASCCWHKFALLVLSTFQIFVLSDVRELMKWHGLLKTPHSEASRFVYSCKTNESLAALFSVMLLFVTQEPWRAKRRTSKQSACVPSASSTSVYVWQGISSPLAAVRVTAVTPPALPLHTNPGWSSSLSPVILYFIIIQGLDVWCKQFPDVSNHKWRVDYGLECLRCSW